MLVLKRITLGIISVILVLYFALWLLSSSVSTYFLSQQLAPQNIKLTDDSIIRYNPFISQLTIKKLTLTKENTTVLSLEHLTLQLALHKLLFKQLVIQKFTIKNLHLQIEQANQQLQVAGVNLVKHNSDSSLPITEEQPTAIENLIKAVLLPQLRITHSQIDLTLNKNTHQLVINNFTLKNVIASQENVLANLAFDGTIDTAKSQLKATLDYKNKQANIGSQFNIQHYPLAKIKPYVTTQLAKLNGFISLNLNPALQLNEQNIITEISNITLQVEQTNLALNHFDLHIPRLTTIINNVNAHIPQDMADDIIFSLASIKINTKQPIVFIDNNLTPPLSRTLLIDTLKLGVLNNQKGEKNTPFSLIAYSNKYEKIVLKGNIKPFAKIPEYQLAGKITELSLPSISPYLKQAMQLELQSGQLNSNITFSLLGDKIQGDVDILIKGLETTSADNNEVDLLKDNTMLPLNTALGMLKDSNDNLELSIPLSGSTKDPQFGVHSFITLIAQKAIMSATKSYLIKTFVPYANVVSVALSASDLLLKVRFEPLYYQLEQIEPDEKQRDYLQQLISLLNDKKSLHIKLCAISVPADINIKNTASLSKKQQQKLLNLGKKREHALKDYLVESNNIDSARLLFCAPKIETKEHAKPRIEFSS